jgi:uncharacterized Zn finger protein
MSFVYLYSYQSSTKEQISERAAQYSKKSPDKLSPVIVKDKLKLATTFWGKAWCENLESYRSFETRLPRGRSYVRAGAVIHLEIFPGRIRAQVAGSTLYHVDITIAALPTGEWQRLKASCAGQVESVVELLMGKISQSVMEIMTSKEYGFIPQPAEIQMSCSCPDYAIPCKHAAAVIYGVGVRLDSNPELLFRLRQVDPAELISAASTVMVLPVQKSYLDSNLSEIFGIEIAELPPGEEMAAHELAPILEQQPEPKLEPEVKSEPAAKPSSKLVITSIIRRSDEDLEDDKRRFLQSLKDEAEYQQRIEENRKRRAASKKKRKPKSKKMKGGLLVILKRKGKNTVGKGINVSLKKLKELVKNPPEDYTLTLSEAAAHALSTNKARPSIEPAEKKAK